MFLDMNFQSVQSSSIDVTANSPWKEQKTTVVLLMDHPGARGLVAVVIQVSRHFCPATHF